MEINPLSEFNPRTGATNLYAELGIDDMQAYLRKNDPFTNIINQLEHSVQEAQHQPSRSAHNILGPIALGVTCGVAYYIGASLIDRLRR